MKNPLQYIQECPERSKRILGVGYREWEQLLEQAKKERLKQEERQEQEKIRINKQGGGRPRILSREEELCLCIFYLRHLPTFEILGLHFGVGKTTANEIFNEWLLVLRRILPCSLVEQIERAEEEWEIMSEILKEYELIVDSWEQPRERPVDNVEQKEFYSGKKRQHTLKGQAIVYPMGKDVVDVKVGEKGKSSDISMFRKQQKKFEPSQKFTGDKGYQGGENIKTPHKKPRNQEITEAQAEENKELASNRIYVEHVIRLLKIFRVAKERYRLNMSKYETVILVIWGLVRLRIGTVNFTNSSEM